MKRNTVRVVEYDPAWGAHFEAEAAAIRHCAGALVLDLQHIGSTAVPGLAAKPILDLAMAVRCSDDVVKVATLLTAAGYSDRGDQGRKGGYLLVRYSEPEVSAVHLHIVPQTDSQWRAFLDFRDLLRRNAGVREEYAEVKRRLATRFPHDRKQYTACKDAFVARVLQEIAAAQRAAGPGDDAAAARPERGGDECRS